ncbi:aprataxin and PNK-like factor isoform X2 [Hemicordylus capensis]|uniref:aprataxin and PNK-like factor isoform X2 n=1 Tax=Hemicordylus capensis TaxID=884348 RepID=UPI002304421A|nr:aprataxin and PNK-like factor isoform X2 [Hemicordylus capensis]
MRNSAKASVTMSGFKLVPADGGGCPVALPPGETVLGRGPLLGITDKRVSRKHAILKVSGDQLSIKPVHVNPCFYRPSENSPLSPLDTDQWHQLSPGDHFSLLVDKYFFSVLFVASDVESLPRDLLICNRLDHNVSTEDIPNQAPSAIQTTEMLHRQSSLQQTVSSGTSKLLETHSLLEKVVESPQKLSASNTENENSRTAQRKRVLPSWMVQGPSASIPGKGNSEETIKESRKKRRTTESDDVILSKQDTQRKPTEPVARKTEKTDDKIATQIAESSVEQCNRQLQNEELELNPDTINKRENRLENVGSKTEQVNQDEALQDPVQKGETQELAPDQTTETETSNLSENQDAPLSSNITEPKRTPCVYGRTCYRKNPIHFQQFSHPGDSDYHDTKAATQTDDDNRPECPYGTACYRKNPQHKLEYKHTVPPEPAKKQMRPKTTEKGESVLDHDSDNDGEPNEYNLDDSFIDDEEEECDPTDEDSDWEPDSQDQNNEDIDTLLKEAQKFVATKK